LTQKVLIELKDGHFCRLSSSFEVTLVLFSIKSSKNCVGWCLYHHKKICWHFSSLD